MNLGKKIKQARSDAKLSQRDLGAALIISEKAISSYESGRSQPSVKTLQKIASKTNKPISFFTDDLSDEALIAALLKNIETELKEIKKIINKT